MYLCYKRMLNEGLFYFGEGCLVFMENGKLGEM